MMYVIGPICFFGGLILFGLSVAARYYFQDKEIKELRQRIDTFETWRGTTSAWGLALGECVTRATARIDALEEAIAPVDDVVSAITGAAECLSAAVAAEVGAIAESDDPTPRPTRRLRGNGA